MSSEAALAGMFPPCENQVWNKHLDWQPIPVHTVPRSDDYLVAAERRCDYYDYVMLQFEKTSAYIKLFEDNKELIKYAEKHSGLRLRTITDVTNLYDTLFIERLKGLWFVSAEKKHSSIFDSHSLKIVNKNCFLLLKSSKMG